MNTLTEAIEDYVRLRHDLAFKLAQTERLLHDFASFMENQEAPFITIEQALQWATSPAHAHPAYWAKRLSAIRLFARYRSATDPRTELPPNGLRPYQPKRAKPYLYTEQDIDRLITQRQVSPNTIASYRDTFRLFLQFAQKRLKKCPSDLAFADVDVTLVEAYLDDLENSRGLSARSRNLRLSAIRSFFCYAAYQAPAHAARIQQILAIPTKRHACQLVGFLTRVEVDALRAPPDTRTWIGRRDHAGVLVACQTGLRLSEMISLCKADIVLDTGAHIRGCGKGRKERCTPWPKPP